MTLKILLAVIQGFWTKLQLPGNVFVGIIVLSGFPYTSNSSGFWNKTGINFPFLEQWMLMSKINQEQLSSPVPESLFKSRCGPFGCVTEMLCCWASNSINRLVITSRNCQSRCLPTKPGFYQESFGNNYMKNYPVFQRSKIRLHALQCRVLETFGNFLRGKRAGMQIVQKLEK